MSHKGRGDALNLVDPYPL